MVVGLDVERARAELARLAPPDLAERIAIDRAVSLELEPAGAAERIADALEVGSQTPSSAQPSRR